MILITHLAAPADGETTVADDPRVSCAGRCAHRMLASAADSGDGEAMRALASAEARCGAFACALDDLERYGYVVRGERLSGAAAGKWVVLDAATVPGVIRQREQLQAQGYEVIEPVGQSPAGRGE